MTKEEFLKALKYELEKYKVNDVENIIEYYDELIEDQKENNKKEEEIVDSLGSISEITKNIIIDQKIERATEKPTISNGFKAWVAALSVMSLPILIPLVITLGALGFTAIILLASFTLVFGALVVSMGFVVIALLLNVFTGLIPIDTFIFALGVALVMMGLSMSMLRWLINLTKQFTSWSIDFLKNKVNSRKGVNDNA